MTVIQVGLLLIGAVITLGILCWGVIKVEKAFPSEKYDERQLLARGRAYRVSFWMGFLYDMFVLLFAITKGGESAYVLFFLGLSLRAMVFHLYCLLTGAALPMSEKPAITIGCYAVMALMYMTRFMELDFGTELTFAREDSRIWLSLIMSVFFSSLSVLHLINFLRDRKE